MSLELLKEYKIDQFKGEYNWLSNMSPCQAFLENGLSYNCVENYYQASKTKNLGKKLQISKMNPYQSKEFGKTLDLIENWDAVKLEVMERGLRYKFTQEKFYNLLINTGVSELIEGNNWNDKFWGVCLRTNKGENNLGKLLMKIRTEFFEELEKKDYLIDSYENIKKLLITNKNIDYKHMDSATIKVLVNEFILKHNEKSLELIEKSLIENEKTYEELLAESGLTNDENHYTITPHYLLKFIKNFAEYLVIKNFKVHVSI